MRIHLLPTICLLLLSRRTAHGSLTLPLFISRFLLHPPPPSVSTRYDEPRYTPLLGESISRLIHRRDKVDKWKIVSFGGIVRNLFSGSYEIKNASGEIRIREEKFVEDSPLDDSTDSLLKLRRCPPPRIQDSWFSVGEDDIPDWGGVSIDGWQLVAGLYISPINLSLASSIEIRLLAIILSDLTGSSKMDRELSQFLAPLLPPPPPPEISVSLLDNWIKSESMEKYFGGQPPACSNVKCDLINAKPTRDTFRVYSYSYHKVERDF